jgi:hypothetical protein
MRLKQRIVVDPCGTSVSAASASSVPMTAEHAAYWRLHFAAATCAFCGGEVHSVEECMATWLSRCTECGLIISGFVCASHDGRYKHATCPRDEWRNRVPIGRVIGFTKDGYTLCEIGSCTVKPDIYRASV